ncbi:MAG: class I SAM-dependent methyltransferase [Fimbriiglobus sp.]|jgi:ubiquinone/menaquinone biosynthesis C-methylase UbiE|nr:class I SAM-dependent methyltransferase [Fimbriiglobus sp.]
MLARIGGYPLLPPEDFVRTGPVDHADWNYRFPLGWISRRRLALATRLLPPNVGRLLKLGYGSGVHLPHWATKAKEIHGIDPHPHAAPVTERLAKNGVTAHLVSGGAEAMPYPDAHFDCVLAISAIEFIPDLPAACQEIRRVLRPGGCLIVVTPGASPLLDFGLKVLSGNSAKKDYGDRRAAVLPTLAEYFVTEKRLVFPPLLSKLVCLYTGLRLRAK